MDRASVGKVPLEERLVWARMIKDNRRARRVRDSFIPGKLFADPAWDILLELFLAELEQQRVPVSSLCLASGVPATTALRWISTLERRGVIERTADPHDGRRYYLALSEQTSIQMARFRRQTRFAMV